MSTTASDEIFAAIEEHVAGYNTIEVEFKRYVLGRPGGWQVTFKGRATAPDLSSDFSGGGGTLKKAFENAFADRMARRLA